MTWFYHFENIASCKMKSFNILDNFSLFLWSLVNGGYGNWTLSGKCNVSCGNGVEIWQRTCDNPVPRYGGNICSELGNSTESRNYSRKPCPSKPKSLTLIWYIILLFQALYTYCRKSNYLLTICRAWSPQLIAIALLPYTHSTANRQ